MSVIDHMARQLLPPSGSPASWFHANCRSRHLNNSWPALVPSVLAAGVMACPGISMKIINCGRGIHAREVRGIEKLQQLPDEWTAFTNLDLALPGKGMREIDVAIVMNDRLVLVDLKDWAGPISSRDGNWFNGKRDCGRSPVHKLGENIREFVPLLKKFIADQERRESLATKLAIPRVDGGVVLTMSTNKDGIAVSEASQVFPIDFFMRMLRNRADREAILGKPYAFAQDFTSDSWSARFRKFFNASTGIFQPGVQRYGGFTALQDSPTYMHPSGVFSEFDVQEETATTSFGLLRKWDFTKADARFQTEVGRTEIAGREKQVVSWLCDRSQACETALLKPKVDDAERGVAYWEVFEKRRRLKRLNEFLVVEAHKMTMKAKRELASQMLAALRPVHELGASHLDIGLHSIWLEQPSSVRISHLLAASYPDVHTLGSHRYQFLSGSRVPEDVLNVPSDGLRKDVFLMGCSIHALIFGRLPAGDPPEWDPAVDSESQVRDLHPWFARSLDLDPSKRFSSAGDMLDGWNSSNSAGDATREVIEGLERFRSLPSQRQVFRTYPESQLIRDDDRLTIWRSDLPEGSRVVKLWKAEAIGDLVKERACILAFLQKAKDFQDSPLPGVSRVKAVHWTGDSIVLVEEFIDGVSLEHSAKRGFADLGEGVVAFLRKLTQTISSIHARGLYHGDLKPANILLTSCDSHAAAPVLIDVMDFCPSGDGQRMSTAYAPPSGTHIERDRFALGRIVEELIRDCKISGVARSLIAGAVEQCRLGPPANATLLPLQEVLDQLIAPQTDQVAVTLEIAVKHAALGLILPDEGRYWVSRAGDLVSLRGATEALQMRLSDDGTVTFARRTRLLQNQIQARRRHEFASFQGQISVSTTAFNSMGSLLDHLAKLQIDIQSDARPTNETSEDRTEPEFEESTEQLADELSEDIAAANGTQSREIDCHRLWKRMVEVEATLVPEAVALGDSSLRKSQRRHVVPIQMVVGELEFDRGDTVVVERQDSKGRWTKIGYLDIDKSNTDHIAIDAWFGNQGGALVTDGSRLRLQSRFENTSRSRRTDATTRILANAAAAPDLLSVFQPSSKFSPTITPIHVSSEDLRTRYDLNPVQIQAFEKIVQHRPVGLLQGPPGTGKTKFIGALIHYALTHGLARNVLLASQAHEAVNHAAEMVLDLFGDDRDSLSLIRVGHEGSVSDSLLPWHVAKVERAYKDRFNATVKDRLALVGRYLGLPDDLVTAAIRFESTIRPVLSQIASQSANGDGARARSLRQTAEQLLPDTALDIHSMDADDVERTVSKWFYEHLVGGQPGQLERFQHVCRLTRDIIGSVSTWHRSFETFLAGTRQVVAGTCVGLGRTSLGLTRTMFDLVIVDEAARCTPSELAVPMQAGKWIVLVGDQAQLEPQHPPQIVKSLGRELTLPYREVAKSDFERVFLSDYGKSAAATLTAQYRMLPPIGRLVSEVFYARALSHERSDPIIPTDALPEHLDLPLLWIDTDGLSDRAYQRPNPQRRGSIENSTEVDIIVGLIRRWAEHEMFKRWLGERPSDSHAIGLISGYSAQRDRLWRRLQTENLPDVMRRSIKNETIDSYQGKQNPVVIVSLVRNNDDGPLEGGAKTIKPGFLARPNRINVAMSRAQDRLVLIGSKERWLSGSPLSQIATAFEREVHSGNAKVIDAAEILNRKTKKELKTADKLKAVTG